MPKPVTNLLPAQPARPKPVYRDLFQEPVYAPGTESIDQDEDETQDER